MVLDKFNIGFFKSLCRCVFLDKSMLFKYNVLKIYRAPNPQDIIWYLPYLS